MGAEKGDWKKKNEKKNEEERKPLPPSKHSHLTLPFVITYYNK